VPVTQAGDYGCWNATVQGFRLDHCVEVVPISRRL